MYVSAGGLPLLYEDGWSFFVSKMSAPRKDQSDVQNGPRLQLSAKDVIDKIWRLKLGGAPQKDMSFVSLYPLEHVFFVFFVISKSN